MLLMASWCVWLCTDIATLVLGSDGNMAVVKDDGNMVADVIICPQKTQLK